MRGGDTRYWNTLMPFSALISKFYCFPHFVWTIWMIAAFGTQVRAQVMHTPKGIQQAIENSSLTFIWKKDTPGIARNTEMNSPYTIVEVGENGPVPVLKNPEGACADLVSKGISAAFKDEYASSMEIFQAALAICEEHSAVYSEMIIAMIGADRLDSLGWASDKAIESNFYNYIGHFGKALALGESGKNEDALREMALAWLLNRNMELLKDQLPDIAHNAGKAWANFSFDPELELRKTGDTVWVHCPPEWLNFGLVRALWKYDGEYRAEMMQEAKDARIPSSMLELKEAIFNQMEALDLPENRKYKGLPSMQAMAKAVKAGMVHDFIFVELLLPEKPYIIFQQSPEMIKGLVDYVLFIRGK